MIAPMATITSRWAVRSRTPRSRLVSIVSTAAMLAVAGNLATARTGAAAEAKVIINSFRPALVDAATALDGILSSHGMTVEIYDDPGFSDIGDLSAYECVWDLRVDYNLSPTDLTAFNAYANAGTGGLYLAGEHGVFTWRNNDVAAFLDSLGGGPVSISAVPPPGVDPIDIFQPTNPDSPILHNCLGSIGIVDYSGIGCGHFTSNGTGTWLTGGPVFGTSTVWPPGSLGLAPNARIIVGLDVNYLSPGVAGTLDFRVTDPTIPTENRQYVTNIAAYLCGFQPPPGGKDPRTHGYWHRYCLGTDTIDPGRNGGGNGPGPSRDADDLPATLLAGVDAKLAPYDIATCAALDDGSFSEPRIAALRELATLWLNMEAGYLGCGTELELHPVVDTAPLTVQQAVDLIVAALASGDDDALRDAVWIGEHVNNGEAVLR